MSRLLLAGVGVLALIGIFSWQASAKAEPPEAFINASISKMGKIMRGKNDSRAGNCRRGVLANRGRELEGLADCKMAVSILFLQAELRDPDQAPNPFLPPGESGRGAVSMVQGPVRPNGRTYVL